MRNESLISVIVPCYNQAQYLPETLDSVIAQTYVNWECIIVNDGSTDNTAEIAQRYCAKDSRFRYVEKKNGGLSSARNVGLEEAKGDYIQFLDSDDLLSENKFKQQLEVALNTGADVVVSRYDMYDGVRHVYFDNEWSCSKPLLSVDGFLYSWGKSFVIAIHAGFFSANFLAVNEIHFNEKVAALEDWIFWYQIANYGARFVQIDNVLAHYRVHSGSMSTEGNRMQVSRIKAAFVIFDTLDIEKKIQFLEKIPADLVEYFNRSFEVKQMKNQRKSLEYALGSILLKPYRFIKRRYSKFK